MSDPRGKNGTKRSKPSVDRSDRSHLSAEEDALWEHVAQSVEPLRSKQRVTESDTASDTESASRRSTHRHSKSDEQARHPVSAKARAADQAPAATRNPLLSTIDPRKLKKLAKGRTDIEARLDLHGLRQSDAHADLRRFLRHCYDRGLKHVLIITGKGRSEDHAAIPYSETLDRPLRGVLRRNVPQWLAEPDLRAIVVGFTSASTRHGGDGAFYVELRRKRE
jgi:DNA-nicking Smr family endonuclease